MARILLIDADEHRRVQTEAILRRLSGHDVARAGTAAEGLAAARAAGLDLVVLDVDLPDLDGFEVCRRLQADPNTAPLSLVFLTDPRLESERRVRGLQAGAVDFIVEPVSGLELVARIDSVLRAKSAADEARRHASELEGRLGEHSEKLAAMARELSVEHDALRETFDVIEDGLFLFDAQGQLQLENAAGQRLRAEALTAGKSAQRLFFEGSEAVAEASLDQVLIRLAGEAIVHQRLATSTLAREGRQFDLRAQPVAGQRALAHIRDVTADRDGEVRRLQSEKLASIGILAAGVAHEINNPASFVLANTEALSGLLRLIEDKLRNDPASARKLGLKDLMFEAMAIVQESKEGMARIHRIVRDLHSFSRVDDDPSGVTDVNAAVDSALTMLRNELRYRADVKRMFEATRPVRGGSARIGQVFLNLILNAAHALPESQLKRNRIIVRSFDDGDWVVVEVEDNGAGIPSELLPRIFDSFFTTKPPGVGTGLGLSISREIVRAAGGEIAVDSQPGKGAVFRVRLPAASGTAVLASLNRTPSPLPVRRRHRLLAIDDEMLLLKAYRRMLIDHHDIELAAGGTEALELLERDRAFDVILCDLQMPDNSGADVFRTVSRRWPGLEQRIIIITGGAFSPEARRFLEEGIVTTVNKPFHLEEILELIDRRAAAGPRPHAP